MLYGRLDDNNTVVEIIDQDPTGRYSADIVWVNIPDDFGLLATKAKNDLLREIKIVQSEANKEDHKKLIAMRSSLVEQNNILQLEREKLEANGVDVDAAWQAANAPAEEEAEEETPAE